MGTSMSDGPGVVALRRALSAHDFGSYDRRQSGRHGVRMAALGLAMELREDGVPVDEANDLIRATAEGVGLEPMSAIVSDAVRWCIAYSLGMPLHD